MTQNNAGKVSQNGAKRRIVGSFKFIHFFIFTQIYMYIFHKHGFTKAFSYVSIQSTNIIITHVSFLRSSTLSREVLNLQFSCFSHQNNWDYKYTTLNKIKYHIFTPSSLFFLNMQFLSISLKCYIKNEYKA